MLLNLGNPDATAAVSPDLSSSMYSVTWSMWALEKKKHLEHFSLYKLGWHHLVIQHWFHIGILCKTRISLTVNTWCTTSSKKKTSGHDLWVEAEVLFGGAHKDVNINMMATQTLLSALCDLFQVSVVPGVHTCTLWKSSATPNSSVWCWPLVPDWSNNMQSHKTLQKIEKYLRGTPAAVYQISDW